MVGDDTYRATAEAGKADDDVFGKVRHDFEEVLVVDDRLDDVFDVIGHVRVFGNDGLQGFHLAVYVVGAGRQGSIFHVVRGEEAEQLFDLHERLFFGLAHEVGHTALAAVGVGAAQLFFTYLFVRNGFHDVGAGNEHVAFLLHHEDEVGEGGRVAGSAGTRAEYGRDLGYDTRSDGVLVEYRGISREAVHALLYAGASRVVEGNDGGAVFERELLHFHDFGGVAFAQRTAVCREVIGIDKDQAPVDFAVTGNHAVAGNLFLLHAEVVAAVRDKLVEFVEGALVEQHVDAFTGGHASRLVLFFYFFDASAL